MNRRDKLAKRRRKREEARRARSIAPALAEARIDERFRTMSADNDAARRRVALRRGIQWAGGDDTDLEDLLGQKPRVVLWEGGTAEQATRILRELPRPLLIVVRDGVELPMPPGDVSLEGVSFLGGT